MAAQEGLGRLFNFVAAASGIHIPLRNATGVTFFVYLDAGTETLAFKESVNGASEQALTVVTKYYKAPGVGGTWTKVTQAASATVDPNPDDATNDCLSVYIAADQLSDGFDSVELTVSAGICQAVIHDLTVQRAPERLASSVV